MAALSASRDLLLSQWRGKPNFEWLCEIFLHAVSANMDTLTRLDEQRGWSGARGVYLDYIGERIGVPRPSVEAMDYSETFGFDSAGKGWDQVRMRGRGTTELRVGLGDEWYAFLLEARAEAMRSGTSLADLERVAGVLGGELLVIDHFDMSVTVSGTETVMLELALEAGILPKAAGVSLAVHGLERVTAGSASMAAGATGATQTSG